MAAALIVPPAAEANTDLGPECAQPKGGATYGPLIRRAYALRKWQDPTPVSQRQARRIETHRRCARSAKALRYMKRASRRHRRQFNEYRDEQLAAQALPYDCGSYGRFVLPCSIVACESGYNFRARNSVSTAGGAYQIIDSTWRAYGGTSYADSHPAAVAPEAEQHQVAANVLRGQGLGAWECA